MRKFCAALMLTLVPVHAIGQTSPQPLSATHAPSTPARSSGADTQSPDDRIWQQFTTLYDNKANSVVQRVLFTVGFSMSSWAFNADQGDLDDWNTRRLRLGPRITLFCDYTLHVEAELNPQEMDPLYMRLTDAYLQWSNSGRLAITIGKQGIPYTMNARRPPKSC